MLPQKKTFHSKQNTFSMTIKVSQEGEVMSLTSEMRSSTTKTLISKLSSSKILSSLSEAHDDRYGFRPAEVLFEGHNTFHEFEEGDEDLMMSNIRKWVHDIKPVIGADSKLMKRHEIKLPGSGILYFSFVCEEDVEARFDFHYVPHSRNSEVKKIHWRGYQATKRNFFENVDKTLNGLLGQEDYDTHHKMLKNDLRSMMDYTL